MSENEGVIKFSMTHTLLDKRLESEILTQLNVWRDLSRSLHFLGQDPKRYHGFGYGNISAREKAEVFLISASQTSDQTRSDANTFARVLSADIDHNRLISEGRLKPSSESMTHAAIYQANAKVNWVLHSHCPEIWQHAQQLGLAETAEHIPYGTPEMARAVQSLMSELDGERTATQPCGGVFVMKGHEDGVVCYGETAAQTLTLMVACYARALMLQA